MMNQPTEKQVNEAYALARERYAALGVNTDAALAGLAAISISLHCWQGDDVSGFENPDAALGGEHEIHSLVLECGYVRRERGAHVARLRHDYLHKLSTELVQKYDAVALENLRVDNMVRNKHLSKSILDSGWSTFRQYLTYKPSDRIYIGPVIHGSGKHNGYLFGL